MPFLAEILSSLIMVDENQSPLADTYETCGFTIYRTAYGESSEQRWLKMVERITTDIEHELKRHVRDGEDGDAAAVADRLWSLLRLDFQSNADHLNDANMDQLRQIFRDNVGGKTIDDDYYAHQYPEEPPRVVYKPFLLVDDEVLAEVSTNAADGDWWIKCVQADYVKEDYIPKNTWNFGQRYFGWMKMTTRSLLGLCYKRTSTLDEIAPETIGGMHLVVWDFDGR